MTDRSKGLHYTAIFCLIHLAIMLATIWGLNRYAPHALEGFVLGSGFILVSVVLLGVLVWLAAVKKAVAMALVVIVLKYGFLGVSIYWAVVIKKITPEYFALGVVSIVGSILIFSIYYTLKEHR